MFLSLFILLAEPGGAWGCRLANTSQRDLRCQSHPHVSGAVLPPATSAPGGGFSLWTLRSLQRPL